VTRYQGRRRVSREAHPSLGTAFFVRNVYCVCVGVTTQSVPVPSGRRRCVTAVFWYLRRGGRRAKVRETLVKSVIVLRGQGTLLADGTTRAEQP